MRLRRPVFYKEFHCISSACRDTCCAGWEIEVDEEAADRYEQVPGPFGERLRSMIGLEDEEHYFILQPGKRCPFLTEDNLCQMIQELGEEALCDICREHPRFYQWFGDDTEVGLGLCCEEAGRLLVSRKEPLTFEVLEEGEESQAEDPMIPALVSARDRVFQIVQDRRYPLEARIRQMLLFVDELQECLAVENAEGVLALAERGPVPAAYAEQKTRVQIEEEILSLLEVYRDLESLDGTWPERIEDLRNSLPQLLEKRDTFFRNCGDRLTAYEHLIVYFLYRYFMEAVFDGNLLAPVRFSAAGLLVVQLLDIRRWMSNGEFTFDDGIQTAKLFSKEVEYCPENMELLSEKCMTESCFRHLSDLM